MESILQVGGVEEERRISTTKEGATVSIVVTSKEEKKIFKLYEKEGVFIGREWEWSEYFTSVLLRLLGTLLLLID